MENRTGYQRVAPTGDVPLNDANNRALVIKMVPDDLDKHLKLNAGRLDSYDKLRRGVMNYLP